ncbi:MAG: hypothetical protein K2X35_01535 [Bryobacteraceae bacterium]|nr:hypothetical protein [Bryobacteraceae bacterium]
MLWQSRIGGEAIVPRFMARADRCQVVPGTNQGLVFSGSVDGRLRAYSTRDGRIVWEYDTAREFPTMNGVKANGGSMDASGPTFAGGMMFVNSGYGTWGGFPGNVLLAFGVG